MANPQLEDGRTEIANDIAQQFARINLSSYEWRVLWVILRKTYGWHKKTDRISYTQLEEATGINRRHIARAITKLLSRNIITQTGKGYGLEYGLQKNYESWLNVTSTGNEIVTPTGDKSLPEQVTNDEKVIVTSTGQESLPIQDASLPKEVTKSLPKQVKTKAIKHLTKAILQKQVPDFLPKDINIECWAAFMEVREEKGAVQSEYALKCIVSDLESLKKQGDDPNEVLKQSITNGWKGVFKIKNNVGYGNNGGKQSGNAAYKPQPPGSSHPVHVIDGDSE